MGYDDEKDFRHHSPDPSQMELHHLHRRQGAHLRHRLPQPLGQPEEAVAHRPETPCRQARRRHRGGGAFQVLSGGSPRVRRHAGVLRGQLARRALRRGGSGDQEGGRQCGGVALQLRFRGADMGAVADGA